MGEGKGTGEVILLISNCLCGWGRGEGDWEGD